MEDKKAKLEAALFLSEDPIERKEIADVLNLGSIGYVDMLIQEFEEMLKEEHRGLELVETAQGYELKVKSDHIGDVDHLAPHQDLNSGELRTLSIIAYNAPVGQKHIIDVRGNRAYQHVKELVNRGFISKEKDGRTSELDVTDFFLDYFNIDSLEEFKELDQQEVEESL